MTEVKEKMVPASCPECEIGPFTRNHYFTGKLLVERDFRRFTRLSDGDADRPAR